ncbi:MAG: aldo/keto reductase [Bacilli bacterium]|jgi:predicted aldo/keto reductase-like oxidoreductase|nr:4Fe-4S dicluster domain-containing protein [Acholeplasmataceae bacterium]
MEYRRLGNTNIQVSALGFGCMRLPEYEQDGKWYIDEEKAIPMLRRAYELGVNYFDTAYYYCHSNSESTVGKALKPFRDKVMISTKIPVSEINSTEEFWKYLNESLKRLDTDYIDFYHLWALNQNTFRNKVLKYNLIEEAMKAKAEGKIRHLSFSFHDKPEVIKEIIDTGKVFDSMLVQYNLLDRSNEEMIDYAHEKGLGVIIMGPVGGGRLAAPTNLGEKLTGEKQSTYELALKFVISNPSVTCALSGMENVEVLEKNVMIVNEFEELSPSELQKIKDSLEELKKFSELYCTGCNYCSDCPQNIKISKIFQLFTYYNVYDLKEYARKSYQEYLKNEKNGQVSDCVACGLCESVCPQKLEVIEELRKVDQILTN